MLELTKLKKRVAEKKAELMNHLRNQDNDRAAWCREDITILSGRVRVLEAKRKIELRERSAGYQRKRYAKGRAEYLAGPYFAADCEAAWKKRFERAEQRKARIAQRVSQVAERKALIAAMGPEERRDFFKSERWKNADTLKAIAEGKAWLESQRAQAAQERRARRSEVCKRNAEERAKILAALLAKTLNTNPDQSPSLLIHHNNEPSSPPNP